ncbi:gamma carbonic anhydrase family protein [Streptomyces chattanoogensis]|uniref:gamma carbonic anhydrase family protein n=1 Tax=Streptomyces chattanoogensis TaxID=66876 RepID=UPI0036903312
MPIYALGDVEPQIHPDAYVHPDATVIGDVRVAAHASVWPQVVLRGDDGRVEVGARTNIQDGSVIHAAPETPAVIGAGTVIGHCVHIEGARVGDGCLVASGSIVLNSSVIESGAMVAAGAVITFDGHVPTGCIALGVPAKNRENTMFPMETVADIVEDYVKSAQRFRTSLRRVV